MENIFFIIISATNIPINWHEINIIILFGLIPANVFDRDLANVTAGFAKLVDAVNQYADVI
jgi:hypothetical protein